MTLAELTHSLPIIESCGNLDIEVLGVTDDSRLVIPNGVFVAVKGEHVNGQLFINDAIAKGAVGIVSEELHENAQRNEAKRQSLAPSSTPQIGWIRVKNSRRALALVATRFFQYPSQQLEMIGVTGTNGKTTVTYMTKALLEAAGKRAGVIGTVGYVIGSQHYTATHTTPGPVELQGLLAKMVASKLDAAILEVSSHALDLDRAVGCEFDTVVYTNLTQDHLDFHADMASYFQAKLRLFTELVRDGLKPGPKRAIVNVDDPHGPRIVEECAVPVWTYSIQTKSDIRAQDLSLSGDASRFVAITPQGRIPIESRLMGEHNVYNMLAAIGVGLQSGLSITAIQSGLQSVENVPGRFERINAGQEFIVIVDYAHTEDALLRLLKTANQLKTHRILTVFGCGGDRDPGKRPTMGHVAARHSDLVILTSDNPRSEDPIGILKAIEKGVLEVPPSSRASYQIIPDRKAAIVTAVHEARPGDMVLIAGKGHEDYQILGNERIHFDDREIAQEAIREVHESYKV